MYRFSIVITVYNKENFISKTLNSVLNQSFDDFEIIVVNDGSTDGSLEVIKKFKNPRISIISQKNQGASAARNCGISAAKGQYIALLDGDDIWKSDYLSEIVRLQNSFPKSKVFATAVEIGSPTGFYPSIYTFENQDNEKHLFLNYFTSSFKNTLLTSSSTVMDRKLFETIGLFDESIKSGQDTDMWIRIGLRYPIAFSINQKVRYTFVSNSLANSCCSLDQKVNFEKFREEEKTNAQLRKFIDLNRYSLSIRAKIWQDTTGAERFRESVIPENLNQRQRFLLTLNGTSLRALMRLQHFLGKMGVRLSAFSS